MDLFTQLENVPGHLKSFSGSDYIPIYDERRLSQQIGQIYDLMKDGCWRTLSEIKEQLEAKHKKRFPESSVSAQIRNLSHAEYGNIKHEKRARGDRSNGLFEYRLLITHEK